MLPTAWRWALSGGPRPDVRQTLRLARAARAAVMRAGNEVGLARLPDAFHGGPGPSPHAHAYWLPEDRDEDGRIDHLLVYAASGLSTPVLSALAATRAVWIGGAALELAPVWIGRPAGGSWFARASDWRAATPFVTPLCRTDRNGRTRRGLDAEAQLRRELARRGLPPVAAVSWLPPAGTGFVVADGAYRPYPDALHLFPAIRFAEPVRGPLAFGFGAHFGLGLMRPAMVGR